MPAFALAHALASAPLAIRRRGRAAAVARAPSSSSPAAVVRSRATTTRRRSGGVRCDAAGGDEAASSSSKKDVDWEQKTREMTAERVMEACMEAMAEGDESKLDACLLELEDPTAKRGVVDDLLDRKKGEGDEFWAAKLRAIAAERVLENCMEAVVRRGAARSVVVSNPVTRRSVAARVDRTPRRRGRSMPSGGCYFLDRSDTAFFFPSSLTRRDPAPLFRWTATWTRSRTACSTRRTTTCWAWTCPPRRTGARRSSSKRERASGDASAAGPYPPLPAV